MSLKRKLVLLSFVMLLVGKISHAQNRYGLNDTIIHEAIVYDGDTIELKTLSPLFCYSRMTAEQRTAAAKYNRLRNAVYVTYPYARKAGIVMNEMNEKLAVIGDHAERKRYIKSKESLLRKEFTDPLTNLSVYQGKVLMKLINRETGNNCYEIIKEYKGGLTARLYQTIAFFFNSNLKQSYDEKNEDAIVEKLVREVQRMYGFTDIRKVNEM